MIITAYLFLLCLGEYTVYKYKSTPFWLEGFAFSCGRHVFSATATAAKLQASTFITVAFTYQKTGWEGRILTTKPQGDHSCYPRPPFSVTKYTCLKMLPPLPTPYPASWCQTGGGKTLHQKLYTRSSRLPSSSVAQTWDLKPRMPPHDPSNLHLLWCSSMMALRATSSSWLATVVAIRCCTTCTSNQIPPQGTSYPSC